MRTAVSSFRKKTGGGSWTTGGNRMGYQQKLLGVVASTGLMSVMLLGSFAPAWAADYKQAPLLDEQVKAGKLPAVANRLSEKPYVETMVDGVGKYGGKPGTTT